jgi:DNA-binding XRE family transcriptional regulator
MTRTLGDIDSPQETSPDRPKRQNGLTIRALREKDGFSQTALAKAVGIRQASLSAIESELADAHISTLNLIARALHVPVGAIMRNCPGRTAA